MENTSNIAVITIPVAEWLGVKSDLKQIAKTLLELKSKGEKELLTPKEAMEVLKCSRNTLQKYIDKGILEPLRMQSNKYSKVLIKRADIEYFLNNNA
jgi:excisionase family DNA binding protein